MLNKKNMAPVSLLSGRTTYIVWKKFRICWCSNRWYILVIKPTRCTNFSNLFLNETVHVSDSSSVHHQEFFTANTAMVYVVHVCRQLASRLSLLTSCLQSCTTYTIAVFAVKNSWWWTEELSETCTVSFKNKFEKLVYQVKFYYKDLSRCTGTCT